MSEAASGLELWGCDAMDAKREHDLAAVMIVVPHEIPDDLPSREHARLAVILPFDVSERSATVQRCKFALMARQVISSPSPVRTPNGLWAARVDRRHPSRRERRVLPLFAQYPVRHAGAGGDNVGYERAHRSQLWGRAQGQLLLR